MNVAHESHPFRGPAVPAIGIIAGSWLVMTLLMTGTGTGAMSHDAMLAGRSLPGAGDLLIFLAAWQVMTGAMMLPSSLPLILMFTGVSRNQVRPRLVLTTFLAAYFAVWTGFALVALFADAGLHALVERWGWLAQRPELITGTVLVGAGLFQFSPLKERCLDACSSPLGFLYRYYRRGLRPAWNLGVRHGLFCLGCCWALMLVMFAVGIGSLAGMAGLTGIMVIEKSFPWGRRLVPVVGVALIAWGVAVVVAPDSFPATLLA